jgi:hypothetical protein
VSEAQRRNLIVGTGPASLAAAMALRRLGLSFEVLDLGYDLEPDRAQKVRMLSSSEPSSWTRSDIDWLFPRPAASRKGVEKRLHLGSEFPYRQSPCLSVTTEMCAVDVSHGFGGFGNVWGAAILPYAAHDLASWPAAFADLARSYRHVGEFVPSSGEADDLQDAFPLYCDRLPRLERSEQSDRLLRTLGAKREALHKRGISFGRSRLAVDSAGGPFTCRSCGFCLDGCVYGAIFNPRRLWQKLEAEGTVIHRGYYALSFEEDPGGVTLATVDVRDDSIRRWRANRLFLGAGTIGTTRLVARSLDLINRPIRVPDSQYFFFPFLSYRGARDLSARFTLAEAFIEILNAEISRHYVHFQVYGLNEIFRRTLHAMLPRPLRRKFLLGLIESRFYLFQGFLNSSDSGSLELTITSTGPRKDNVHIRGVTNPASAPIARKAQALLRRSLLGIGHVPFLPPEVVMPGRSFHAGASFPAGGNDPTFSSDMLCRPAGLRRVHLLGAVAFPSIPATTITYTAMATADRVIEETHRHKVLA